MAQHSKYSPSSAFRLVRCPGSAQFKVDPLDQGQNPRTIEGNKAHAMIAAYLPEISEQLPYDTDLAMEQFHNFNRIVDEAKEAHDTSSPTIRDIMFGATSFLQYCLGVFERYWDKGFVIAELHSEIFLGDSLTGGTADVLVIFHHPGEGTKVCVILDYKHGFGIIEPDGGVMEEVPRVKTQILAYMRLAMYQFKVDGFEGWIVQPFGDSMRGIISGGLVEPRIVKDFDGHFMYAVSEAENKTNKLKFGGAQCYRCPGRTECPKFQQVFHQIAKEAGLSLTSEQDK